MTRSCVSKASTSRGGSTQEVAESLTLHQTASFEKGLLISKCGNAYLSKGPEGASGANSHSTGITRFSLHTGQVDLPSPGRGRPPRG